MALAALEAIHQFESRDAAITAGWGFANEAESYFAPKGILPRMRIGACGVWNRGEQFKRADDAKWWTSRYKFAATLWDTLQFYAAVDRKRMEAIGQEEPAIVFDEDMAKGDAQSIAEAEARVITDDWPNMRDSKCEPPFFIPTTSAIPGPMPNPKCSVGDEPHPLPKLPNPFAIPWWVWLGIGLWVATKTRR